MPKSLEPKVEELSRELVSQKEERDKLNLETREWAKRRNSLHEQIKNMRAEVTSLRERRDALNEKVRGLKSLREQTRAECKEKRVQILKVKEKLRHLMDKKPSRGRQDLENEFESLEWKIQTTPLTIKEEKAVVDQVKLLEAKLLIHKQIQKLRDSLIELQAEEKALEAKATLYHEELSELAEQSQRLHERMLEAMNRARALQAEAGNAHQKYVETRQRSQEVHQKYAEMLLRVRALKQELSRAEEEKQSQRQLELHKELEKRALEKLKRGEKLTWEEFKILAEQGIV